ncbi:MAG: tetratricopeptide repeat protein, partial [Acidobacteria bacterium]|nr:tetratricopeptide repeat protein [Acidobacteriota bacterium]
MSNKRPPRTSKIVVGAVIVLVAALVGYSNWRDARRPRDRFTVAPPIGMPGAPRTSREDLAKRIRDMQARLAARPDDTGAAVLLADALLRQTRVNGNAGLARKAEQVLQGALKADPGDYEALRMLATVYLSQHRFRDAIGIAERTRALRPHDAWNFGVIGDANIELGEYDQAFDAFDTMVKMRPSAAAYARVAYARELQGNLEGALQAMQMAAEATSAHDPESQAWHYAQVGDLYLQMGRLDESRQEFEHAELVFPGHPFATAGRARVLVARGEYRAALDVYRRQLEKTPTPDLAARTGDLYQALGDHMEAERHYALAETGWTFDTPEPTQLARFLVERGRKPDEALKTAERAAADRHDIFTEDTLAWAYFHVNRIRDAAEASARALRTGTRDRQVLYHAAAIQHALGKDEEARQLLERALSGNPRFDVVTASAAAA